MLAASDRSLKLFAYAEAFELARQGMAHCQQLAPASQLPLKAQFLRICAIAGTHRDRAPQLEADIQQLIRQAQQLNLPEAAALGLEAALTLQFEQSNFDQVHQQSLRAAAASRLTSPATAACMLAYSGSCLAEIGRDLLRAEALLLEAQSLADRIGLELCDVFCGLGCVHRHYGRYDQARSHLQQAWQLALSQQDHWREFTILSYLAMTELDDGNPAAALPICDQMAAVAEQIQGEGSETVVAAALAALMQYRLQPQEAAADVQAAMVALQRVDAKRMLAYVLSRAAEGAIAYAPTLAVDWATTALQNAKIVNHPSEIALSWAMLVQSLLTLGEKNQAALQFEAIQQNLDPYLLSVAAQTAVEQVSHALAPALTARRSATLD
jgi:tetratricopeptide (TPR) repeat protein